MENETTKKPWTNGPWRPAPKRIADLAPRQEFRSNALLISSAPDMADALAEFVSLWERWAKDSQFLTEPLRRSYEMRVEEGKSILHQIKYPGF